MEFKLTEEQEMLKKSAQDFLTDKCDKKVVKKLEESEDGFSREIWDAMAELSWMGIIIPEEYDGVGCNMMELAVLFEAYGRAALNGPMLSTAMGTLAIMEGGSEDLKSRFLTQLAAGKLIMSWGMEEPEVATDPRFIATQAVGKDDGYALTGTKLFVPYASVADYLLVIARTGGAVGDEQGLTVFLVDSQTTGIKLSAMQGIAGDKQFQVELDNVQVSSADIVGELNQGLSLVKAILEKGTAIQCAEMVGGAEYELEITAEYCRTRIQFEQPIGSFQAVQHRLADMFVDVQGARWTTYQAVWRMSEGMPAGREAAIAKIFTNKAVQRVAFSAQQLHAGMGYDLDHELHYYYRRAKALELKLGSIPAQLINLEGELGL